MLRSRKPLAFHRKHGSSNCRGQGILVVAIQATAQHHDAIQSITIAAFEFGEFGHNGEAQLIDAIEGASDQTLSLVAVDGSDIVGHILLSPARIVSQGKQLDGMGLAPMSVSPDHQRQGIGSLLVKAALEKVSEQKIAFTIVAGHPGFYPRFGFKPASVLNIQHGFAGMPQDIFFVHCNDAILLAAIDGGLAYYHPAFGPQHVAQ